jgi:hypothetical protein
MISTLFAAEREGVPVESDAPAVAPPAVPPARDGHGHTTV